VRRLTPLLRRIGCVVSWTTAGAETGWVNAALPVVACVMSVQRTAALACVARYSVRTEEAALLRTPTPPRASVLSAHTDSSASIVRTTNINQAFISLTVVLSYSFLMLVLLPIRQAHLAQITLTFIAPWRFKIWYIDLS